MFFGVVMLSKFSVRKVLSASIVSLLSTYGIANACDVTVSGRKTLAEFQAVLQSLPASPQVLCLASGALIEAVASDPLGLRLDPANMATDNLEIRGLGDGTRKAKIRDGRPNTTVQETQNGFSCSPRELLRINQKTVTLKNIEISTVGDCHHAIQAGYQIDVNMDKVKSSTAGRMSDGFTTHYFPNLLTAGEQTIKATNSYFAANSTIDNHSSKGFQTRQATLAVPKYRVELVNVDSNRSVTVNNADEGSFVIGGASSGLAVMKSTLSTISDITLNDGMIMLLYANVTEIRNINRPHYAPSVGPSRLLSLTDSHVDFIANVVFESLGTYSTAVDLIQGASIGVLDKLTVNIPDASLFSRGISMGHTLNNNQIGMISNSRLTVGSANCIAYNSQVPPGTFPGIGQIRRTACNNQLM